MSESQSLDPRIRRQNPQNDGSHFITTSTELVPYQSFWQQKAGGVYEHAGIVHAPDATMALLYAKEQFSRRGGSCVGIKVIATDKVVESGYTEGTVNAFDTLSNIQERLALGSKYQVFALKKRGKQHIQVGQFLYEQSTSFMSQMALVRIEPCANIWLLPEQDINSTTVEDEGLWQTLPDKRYRDAAAYKSADLIAIYKARQVK